MPQFTVTERVWLVEQYFLSCGQRGRPSLVSLRQSFSATFHKNPPTKRNLVNMVKKFRANGSLHNTNKQHSGRRRSMRTNDNSERVFEKVLTSPRKSQRRMSKEITPFISRSTLQRILSDLGAFSYKVQIMHQLRPCDFSARREFCARVLANLYEDPEFLQNWWWSDESHFLLSGHVNRQNMRFLGWSSPEEYEQRPLHSEKVTVWCALSSHGIIGPYFFENENEVAINVNAERYRNLVIDRFHGDLLAFCEMRGLDFNKQFFQQDGASSHTGCGNLQYLQYLFQGQLISRKSDFSYPAHSPDLTPLDAFLWGMLKQECFHEPVPHTCSELKANIERTISAVHEESCRAMVEKVVERMEECLSRDGGHMEHVIRR